MCLTTVSPPEFDKSFVKTSWQRDSLWTRLVKSAKDYLKSAFEEVCRIFLKTLKTVFERINAGLCWNEIYNWTFFNAAPPRELNLLAEKGNFGPTPRGKFLFQQFSEEVFLNWLIDRVL